ncbi:MAG: MATE family efflux transporter, partial [Pseudomonadota bacterium]|nr:MATE family efflux transporter [Pseudomonadota bacterium]
ALLRWAGVDPALAARTGIFLWGISLGFPAAMVYRSLTFYSASIGHPRPAMVLAFVGLGVNAFLNWVLIRGHWGAPALGGAGCGWATGIGMWVALLAMLVWTRCARAYRPYTLWTDWHWPRWDAQRQLLRIGLPMGGAGFIEVTAFAGIAVLVARFGDVQIAAHQIALNLSSLTFMLPMGLSAAVTIRVGQALGTGDRRLARFIAFCGLHTGMALGLLLAGAVVTLRHRVAGLYSDDESVQALAANLLLLAAFWQVFDAAQVCAIGGLRGYKSTMLPMLLMLAAFWGIGLPLGAVLGYHGLFGRGPLEVYGFWIGLLVALVLVATALVLALRRITAVAYRPG